jgi:hypothetical protein
MRLVPTASTRSLERMADRSLERMADRALQGARGGGGQVSSGVNDSNKRRCLWRIPKTRLQITTAC